MSELEDKADAVYIPFRALGHNRGMYFFMAYGTGQLVSLTPSKFQKQYLLSLAPLQWWETHYAGRQGPDWVAAANDLMRDCEREGVFDPSRLRGRGCWREVASDGTWRIVTHLGDRLIVDNSEVPVQQYRQSSAIYEQAIPMKGPASDELTKDECRHIADVFKLVRWDSPGYALLAAGVTVLSPVCGAMTWRPHAWITGGRGTGKTWIVSSIMRPLMGGMVHHVQGDTTEAGVRQMLRADAIPVIFDEAEGNEKKDQQRIQSVLSLMRQASSESGAKVVKGSADGTAMSYDIRSAFILASIGVGIKQGADATRITVLPLRSPDQDTGIDRQAHWEQLKEKAHQITPDMGRRLVARTIRLLPVVLENATTFASVMAERTGSQRLGDQYGAIIAGAYSLISERYASHDAAEAFVNQYDWSHLSDTADVKDEDNCLQAILQRQVMVDGNMSKRTVTVSELVAIVCGHEPANDNIDKGTAEDHLRRFGMRVYYPCLMVANRSEWIASALRDTPFANSWPTVLMRLPYAEKVNSSVRFSPHHVSRAVAIDLEKMATADL